MWQTPSRISRCNLKIYMHVQQQSGAINTFQTGNSSTVSLNYVINQWKFSSSVRLDLSSRIRVIIHNLKHYDAGWSHYNSRLTKASLVKRLFLELSGRYLRRHFALPEVRLLLLRARFGRVLISSDGLSKSLCTCVCKNINFDSLSGFVKF
jgi:hypothetical protein